MKNILAYAAILVLLISCRKKEFYSISASDDEFYAGETYTFSLDREPKEKVFWFVNGEEMGEGKSISLTLGENQGYQIKCYKQKSQRNLLCSKDYYSRGWGSSLCGWRPAIELRNNYNNSEFFGRATTSSDIFSNNRVGVRFYSLEKIWQFEVIMSKAFEGKISGQMKETQGYGYGSNDYPNYYDIQGTASRNGDIVTFEFDYDTLHFKADYLLAKSI